MVLIRTILEGFGVNRRAGCRRGGGMEAGRECGVEGRES
jgi:hypothetical protein